MTRKKTIWGFFLTKINKQHELILDQTYADLLDCLAACVVASDFTRFHNYLKELNYSSDFTFVSELAEKTASTLISTILENTFLLSHSHFLVTSPVYSTPKGHWRKREAGTLPLITAFTGG